MNSVGAQGLAAQGLATVSRAAVQTLLDVLAAERYQVIGPVMRDGAIVYEPVSHLSDLPIGWTDRQEPGRYRLERRDDEALFGFAVGPQSWKRFLQPPVETLWTDAPGRRRRHHRERDRRRAQICLHRRAGMRTPRHRDPGSRARRRAPMRTWLMQRAGKAPSSSPSIAGRRGRRAFASRCRRGRRPTADSIWR